MFDKVTATKNGTFLKGVHTRCSRKNAQNLQNQTANTIRRVTWYFHQAIGN